jgi:two-component system, response regulator, stage 0 sporulation protein F
MQTRTRPTKIFLAEDDPDMRALVASALRADGYEVTEARDGAELLDLLGDVSNAPWRKPDLIVTDVMMPAYSGLGVLGALHNTKWQIPIFVITARRDRDVAEDAFRLGATRVFRKPFDMTDLRAAIIAETS